MSRDFNKGIPGQIPGLDLGNVVADVASSFVEAINLGRPAPGSLHRNLKISLAHLVAEIKSVDVVQALVCQTSLQRRLQQIAQCLNEILCGDYVKAQYRRSVEEEARRRTPRLTQLIAFFLGKNEDLSPSALIEKWCRYPLPILGMFRELVCRSGLRGLDIKRFLKDDDHLLGYLTALVKDWNRLVDQIYDGSYSDNGSEVSDDADCPQPPTVETLLRGEDSVHQRSQFLYDILHKTWPCQSESHNHDGRLGLCLEAKFYLDPRWSEKDHTHDGFFILLAGPEILQECRIYVKKIGMEKDVAACLVSHDDQSRGVCLYLMSDGNNQLWDQRRSARPLELIVAEDEHVDMSLSQLLMTVKPTYAAKRVMGVTLARCILHLVEGSWVSESLSVEDIYVYCKMQNDLPRPLFHKIFIATKFDVDHDRSRQPGAYRIHPFPTILALGIVLLELELGEDLPEIKDRLSFDSKRRNPFYLAQHLLREFRERYNLDSGLLQAVEFCIDRTSFSRFATRTPEAQVSNQEFIETYYNKILRPLERDLVKGAHWTWDQVAQLKHPSLADAGISKVLNKRSFPLNFTHETSSGLNEHQSQQRVQTAVTVTTLESRKDTHLNSLGRPPPQILPSSSLKHQPQAGHSTLNGSSLHESPILSSTLPSKPQSRDDFEVAIICALQTEANAVQAMFDKHWDEDSIYQYKKQANDPNSYSAGLIGNHNVVLAHQPRMGKVTAANVAAACSMSFTKLKLALIVGVCGGVPAPESSQDILLGDVVFSKGIVQYDFGRRYPDRFRRKTTVDDQLGRPNREISSLLAKLETTIHRQRLQATIASYLDEQDHRTGNDIKQLYPGPAQDRLFQASYNHKHQEKSRYCVQCMDEICDEALNSTCEELKCDRRRFVRRLRKNERNRPFLHFGLIASGDTVLKSGTDRDEVAREAKVIAFEMEGSGVWDTIPCVVIKGVCDYADSHKNKLWQDYAAMTAAASAKAFLRHWSANG